MKFVPQAEKNMSESNSQKIEKRLTMHTTMKGNASVVPTEIKDPNMKLECLGDKSIGETILEIMMPDRKDPVFRHFQKDWHPDIERRNYSLVYHSAFKKEAEQCAITLKNVLVDQYGDGVLEAFKNGMRGLNNQFQTYGDDLDDMDFEIDDDDDKFHRITVTNLNIMKEATTENQTNQIDKGDDSLLTGMGNTVALSHTSDKTNRTVIPTVATTTATKDSLVSDLTTHTTKSTPIMAELETDLETGLGTLLTRQDIKAVLEEGTINHEILKNILQTILQPGTSADGEPGKSP